MITSRINCFDHTKSDDLELQDKILVEYSYRSEYIIQAKEKAELNNGASSLLGRSISFMSPLVFLGTLRCTAGDAVHTGWTSLKSNLCGLIYVENCFINATLRGEDVPKINVADIFSSILNKAGIHTNIDNAPPIGDINNEESIDTFFYIGDQIGAVCRSLIFNQTNDVLRKLTQNSKNEHTFLEFINNIISNRTGSMLKELTENSMDTYYFLYLLSQMDKPDTSKLGCTYTNNAIKSNVSSNILSLILSTNKISTLKTYCPTICEYIPIDKYAADPKELIINKIPALNIEPKSNAELNIIVVVLAVAGILLFSLYAMANLIKRKRFFFIPRNYICRALRRTLNHSNYRRLDETTV
ncbi:hypothetical protein [Candidatus Ichthyocystis sparus]|uniref:hypothetical protein n=1 Tax=Candidatus Ichthyocystis sparus TaxID=1561004 RepID=UPI000B814E43|nr:hypothetical protein [Candidatus Ichthyocystis sparus]